MSNLFCKTSHHLRSAFRAASSPIHDLYFLQIHPFSSSATSVESTPNRHPFVVTYLMNSCGFPLEKALSASKYVKNFETPDKPDSVLAFFENHGFTKTQISNLVRKFPPVLLSDPEKTLLPKLEFFKSKGVSNTDVAKIVSSTPKVLRRSLENQIIPSFNFYKKLLQSEEETISAIKRYGRILLLDVQINVAPNIEVLREAGVPNEKIVFFLKYQPRGFMSSSSYRFRQIVEEVQKMGFNPLKTKFVSAVHALRSMSKSTWEKKVVVYKKWGWSDDEILVTFRKYPECMKVFAHKIMRVMDFFVNKMGWESSLTARRPVLLTLSLEKRIVPRCAVYQVLLSKGLIKNMDFSVAAMLVNPEKWFLKKVVNCHEGEALELLKLYEEKLALAK